MFYLGGCRILYKSNDWGFDTGKSIQQEEKIVINITAEQKKYLLEQSVDIGEALEADDLGALLLAIDGVIVDNIVGHNDEPDETGIKLQRIYDQIFNQNTED